MAYQMMFAVITPALITGAFAERMKFSAFVVFSLLWATFVYDPLAHMVWGGGIVGTTWGAIATGLFATKAINSIVSSEGLLVSGSASLLGVQILAVLVTYGLAIVGTLVCLGIAGLVTGGIRVDEDAEFAGLDVSQHSETAYVLGAAAQTYEPLSGAAAQRN